MEAADFQRGMPYPACAFTVLLVEDDLVSSKAIQACLCRSMPDIRLLHAKTIQEAQCLVAEFEADLFILDVILPDGSGLDFLADVQTLNPQACVILTSAMDAKRVEQIRSETGVQYFMPKPVDWRAMTALVRGYVEEREQVRVQEEAAAPAAVQAGFSARLKEAGAIDVIQFRCMTRTTAMLEFATPDLTTGLVHLAEGRIVHAETGQLTGMEALVEILSWNGGAVREVPGTHTGVCSITGSADMLLMHAAHQLDERQAGMHAVG